MDAENRDKTINIHRGIIIARWIWIAIGGVGGEVLRAIRESAQSPLNPPPKIAGISLMLALAILQITLNLSLYLYIKFRGEKTNEKGFALLSFIQVYFDLAIFSAFFFYSGAIESPGAVMLFVPLIIALIVYRWRGIVTVSAITIIIFSVLTFSQYYANSIGGIPHYHAFNESIPKISINPVIVGYYYYTFLMAYFGASIFGSVVSSVLKRREAELIIERDKTTAIINNMVDGVIVYTIDNKISYMNPSLAELLKIKASDYVDKQINENINSTVPILYQILNTPMSKEKVELTYTSPKQLTLQVSTANISNVNNKLFGYMKVVHNITREKEIDKIKSEFISVVSHQLRTPLSAIKWTIQMIIDKDLGETTAEQDKFLKKSFDANEQMIRLVNDLLNVSRIEEGRFLYKFQELSVEEVLSEAVQEASLLIEKMKTRNIKFTFNKPNIPLPHSKLDKEKIKIAVANLIENSDRYTEHGEIKINIHYDEKANQNIIAVSDTGFGILEEDKKLIFKKFFRGYNISKATEGTGLGLYLVKNIIEKHNGRIWFESTAGKGTTFFIGLPTIQPSPELITAQKSAQFSEFIQDI
ncbi:MAG: hypothetical protein COU81_00470 [Candidatus Portnoybacteria bacterium CG10_big_fil_rev_8_21_14_0_10_36_7]|uniref:histidine kinase n=1 Tax=Candidatus Portnoybacteria bacterium CG10_big_fil_rev_8_21_14_0_10_36_7 TaxID=1974812 RepID=A0A2M8KEZ5_9BACT|nr:MAG: hypothetical protein COU81_00470 [Candidatus Portnoybacteria bacterium CG10_big_fil_rev_8_21_14_0_10_36_7]